MSVAQNMIDSVSGLETLSQTVRLERGSVDDGITKGNMDAPAVAITPVIASPEQTKAISVRPRRTSNTAQVVPR